MGGYIGKYSRLTVIMATKTYDTHKFPYIKIPRNQRASTVTVVSPMSSITMAQLV